MWHHSSSHKCSRILQNRVAEEQFWTSFLQLANMPMILTYANCTNLPLLTDVWKTPNSCQGGQENEQQSRTRYQRWVVLTQSGIIDLNVYALLVLVLVFALLCSYMYHHYSMFWLSSRQRRKSAERRCGQNESPRGAAMGIRLTGSPRGYLIRWTEVNSPIPELFFAKPDASRQQALLGIPLHRITRIIYGRRSYAVPLNEQAQMASIDTLHHAPREPSPSSLSTRKHLSNSELLKQIGTIPAIKGTNNEFSIIGPLPISSDISHQLEADNIGSFLITIFTRDVMPETRTFIILLLLLHYFLCECNHYYPDLIALVILLSTPIFLPLVFWNSFLLTAISNKGSLCAIKICTGHTSSLCAPSAQLSNAWGMAV